ncbi:hypothetical protein KSP39_PZI021544 [Platanthera zijinensis]|uniref:Fe2OG dioxygenase domain-containing protein n=1 Tax=Platanthera zijinensis TaxID=2320716 RepID=A0AAP0FWC2_9ASPA
MGEASEVPGGFDGYFRASSCGLEHIKATGWDTDPESEQSPDYHVDEVVDRKVEELNLGSVQVPSNAADRFDGYFRASPERREHIKATGWDADPAPELPKVRMSWADMVQQDQLEEEEKEKMRGNNLEIGIEGEKEEVFGEQREGIGFSRVGRKKDFVCLERIDGRIVNILEGLELHTGVFSVLEQKQIVDFVYELQEKGRNNGLGEHTYSEESEPRTHMRARGHATIQFGCCYNYMEHNGIPQGIIHGVVADPMPNLFKTMIKRLISWHVMPASCVPDSCRVNIYEPGDFEPRNIDSNDFVRPFCTASFLNEGSLNFGSNPKDNDAVEFTGSTAILLPVGSALVFNGKGANVAKHCVAAVPSKRISITFRKMEKPKRPQGLPFKPDLQNIRPYCLDADSASNGRANGEVESFIDIRNGAKIRQNSKKVGGFAPERPTSPTPNHSRIERSRDCNTLLWHHRGVQDESEEFPGRFQLDLKNDDGGKNCRGRSVRIEEKRIIVTRNLENDDARSGRTRAARPQIHIQTYNNSRRRVRLIR